MTQLTIIYNAQGINRVVNLGNNSKKRVIEILKEATKKIEKGIIEIR